MDGKLRFQTSHFDAGKSLILFAHKAMGVEAVMSFKFESNGR